MNFDFVSILSATMVLFAVIDITGSIPIILDLESKTGKIKALKATLVAFGMMMVFLIVGEPLLGIFGVDISSFAIAGSLVLFFLGVEMILGIELFKLESLKESSIVPIAFPLIAGAGTMTTLITLKAEYQFLTILIALVLNMAFVYFVLSSTRLMARILGQTGIMVLRKFFGIILLAISVKLFLTNTGIELPHG
jgi:multiple antibiotic resistance protein